MRTGAFGAAIAAALVAGTAVPAVAAKCIPSKFKETWLVEQEQLGGDTINRYVGLTTADLIARLSKEPAIPAGSFPDPHTARLVISAALLPDEKAYDSWASRARAGERAEVRMAFEQPIGIVVERGNAVGRPAHGLRVILEATGTGTCRLVTAFPTIG